LPANPAFNVHNQLAID